MALPAIRERLNAKLDHMSDEQLAVILRYAEVIDSAQLPAEYDLENDPAIGFLSGSTDVARHTKQILRDEITARSGWTQKKD